MNSDGSADSIGVQPAVPEAPWRHAIRFVLVEPSHVGNIGAAARAIAAMGFARLCVVRPRDPAFGSAPEAVALAAAAGAVLAAAEVYATLEAALAGVDLAFATTGYARTMAGAPLEVRASAHQAAGAWHAQGAGIAFVFGTERTGLSNADVQRCHACCSIPCDPRMGSLNLAQAVQVVAYECRRALLAGDPDALQPAPRRDASQGALREADPAASVAQTEALFRHLEEGLVALGYLDPEQPRHLMARVRRLLMRARLTVTEVDVLRGIAAAMVMPRRLRAGGKGGARSSNAPPNPPTQPPPER